MKIEMPTPFHGNFVVSIRTGDREERERCQKLFIREIDEKMVRELYGNVPAEEVPTHQVSFHDFGCRRVVEGKLIRNEKNRVAFLVQGKEYEFMPFVPRKA
ncbi:MAG TPA: hypothetical protein PKY58_03950 [Syntrophales bacterium]|nr:hypothetical protein [Syntrophales bacterium]HPX11536.1 hypothetical protein [Syntrophales bacterium]HQB30026.1 hypothetical protein [Syntrophales bacterium]HQN76833.1 hypothetical protein [Syntrophales bacterium]HQQ26655.1 hypothetical protein [Syntrophales bacterium]